MIKHGGAHRVQRARLVVGVAGRIKTTIAGNTATKDQVFRYAVANARLPRDDAPLATARQSSANPARVLRLPEAGLAVGGAADMIALDGELAVTDVLRRGSWVNRPAPEPPERHG